jgi:hypothetical protein
VTTSSRAVTALVVSAAGIACVYATAFLPGGPPTAAVVLMIVCIATMMVSVMTLGAARGGHAGRLAAPFAAVWIIVVVGFVAALLLPAETLSQPALWFGVPRRTALVLYGVGLLPLLGLPLAYAATFDHFTLSDEHLTMLRARAAEIRARAAEILETERTQ